MTAMKITDLFTNDSGIAHTRWVTHGEPAPRNSHPQTSGPGNEFLVVHNGVITNYEVLKATLLRHGFTFESETDTEVIPKLQSLFLTKQTKLQVAEEIGTEVKSHKDFLEVMVHHFLDNLYFIVIVIFLFVSTSSIFSLKKKCIVPRLAC